MRLTYTDLENYANRFYKLSNGKYVITIKKHKEMYKPYYELFLSNELVFIGHLRECFEFIRGFYRAYNFLTDNKL